jgi:hypothetical protein
MFELPKGWWVSSGGCCTCSSWGRSLWNAGQQLLMGRRSGGDFFFQIGINEFSKLVAKHLQVGLGIRWAVMF